jgi:hypothetical protein
MGGPDDPEAGAAYIGSQTGPGIGLVNADDGDMWGAGARWNFQPRWQDSAGNFVDPNTGQNYGNWQAYHNHLTGAGGNMANGQNPQPGNVPSLGVPNSGVPNLGAPNVTPGTPTNDNSASSLFPWEQRWTGGFQAPLSPYEQQGLTGLSNFASNGFGTQGAQNFTNSLMGQNGPLSGAQGYLSNVLQGNYLSPNNPYFDQIQQSGQTLLNQQQDRTLRELQSRAAAGGNGLSGALMQQESDYLQGSNAAFDQTMAQLRANQYAAERGYQQGAAGLQDQLVGTQLSGAGLQNQLANTQLGGYGSLMTYGAVPRNLQSNEMQSQYMDWLRSINSMQQAYQYPDQQLMALLTGGGYHGLSQPAYGESPASQLSQYLGLLGNGGNGIDWSGIVNGIGGLFGGDNTTASTDGHPVSYDGGPSSYQDQSWYNNALTAAQAKKNQMQNPTNTGMNAGLGTAGLFLQALNMLFGHGNSGNKGGVQFGGGQGGNGGKSGLNLIDALKNALGGGKQDPFINNATGTPNYGLYQDPIGPGLSDGGNASYWSPTPSDSTGEGTQPWDNMWQNPPIGDSGGGSSDYAPTFENSGNWGD